MDFLSSKRAPIIVVGLVGFTAWLIYLERNMRAMDRNSLNMASQLQTLTEKHSALTAAHNTLTSNVVALAASHTRVVEHAQYMEQVVKALQSRTNSP